MPLDSNGMGFSDFLALVLPTSPRLNASSCAKQSYVGQAVLVLVLEGRDGHGARFKR